MGKKTIDEWASERLEDAARKVCRERIAQYPKFEEAVSFWVIQKAEREGGTVDETTLL